MIKEERKLAAMAAMPATKPELQKKLGMARSTLGYVLEVLKQEGRCHVGGYVKVGGLLSGGKLIDELHAGPGPDAPRTAAFIKEPKAKPKPVPVPRVPASRVPRRDPLVAALFGPA